MGKERKPGLEDLEGHRPVCPGNRGIDCKYPAVLDPFGDVGKMVGQGVPDKWRDNDDLKPDPCQFDTDKENQQSVCLAETVTPDCLAELFDDLRQGGEAGSFEIKDQY
ncbi:MAG: hypothetical protein KKG35_09690 [Proteobacteria bacterium]|nr:hypothetical protein [Pseudomonadota bacterium]